jgi:hypothetical protein
VRDVPSRVMVMYNLLIRLLRELYSFSYERF